MKLIPIWATLTIIYYGVNLTLPTVLIKMRKLEHQNLNENKENDYFGIVQ